MASQFALLFVSKLKVPATVLVDLDQERADKAWPIARRTRQEAGRGRRRKTAPTASKALVTGEVDYQKAFGDADFIIEAVFEEMGVKQTVFHNAELVAPRPRSSPPTRRRCRSPKWPQSSRTLTGWWVSLLQPGRGDAAAGGHQG